MRAEKIAVMSKVNEGKISPEEGCRLYEELRSQPCCEEEQPAENSADFCGCVSESRLREKMNNIYTDAEPYLRKTILSVSETAVFVSETVRDKIRDELNAAKDKKI